ncbi:MAG: S8 family serine peptidase, partial [Bifidobacteriaceae bacterium]|nr:S8 family serine peptidase [Bifidobacteriaceae bacterium]
AGAAFDGQVVAEKLTRAAECGIVYLSDVYDSFVNAIDVEHVRVISMSMSWPEATYALLEQSVNYAAAHNVLVVASGGNEAITATTYPSAYPTVLSVGASDKNGNQATWNNRSGQLDIWAPGVSVTSTYPNGSNQTVSGTSFSAPLVAAAASLLWRYQPTATADEVRYALTSTARGTNRLLDVEAAVAAITGPERTASVEAISIPQSIYPGDTVTATVTGVVPTGATLSYAWYVGRTPEPLGAGPSFTVPAGRDGQPIWVVVTASASGWTDSVPRQSNYVSVYAAQVGVEGQLVLSDGGSAVGYRLNYFRVTCDTHVAYPIPASELSSVALSDDGRFKVGKYGDECYRIDLESPHSDSAQVTINGVTGRYHYLAAGSTGVVIQTERLTVNFFLGAPVYGTPEVGETLRVLASSQPPDADVEYTWLRDGQPIPGATDERYTVTAADAGHELSVRVYGTAVGCLPATVTSDPILIPGGDTRPLALSSASLSGTGEVGQTLTVDAIYQPVDAELTYQWFRGTKLIAGASGPSYTLVAADAGGDIVVKVYASSRGQTVGPKYTGHVLVAGTLPQPLALGSVTVTGAAPDGAPNPVGTTLVAAPAGLSPANASVTYQWFRGTSAVSARTAAGTYVVKAADAGWNLVCKAWATDGSGEVVKYSAHLPGPLGFAALTVSGETRVGMILTATADYVPAGASVTYQWFRGSSAIAGAKSATYTLTDADLQQDLVLKATLTWGGTSVVKYSAHLLIGPRTKLAGVTGRLVSIDGGTVSSTVMMDSRYTCDGTYVPSSNFEYIGVMVAADGSFGSGAKTTGCYRISAGAMPLTWNGQHGQYIYVPAGWRDIVIGYQSKAELGAVEITGTVKVGQTIRATAQVIAPYSNRTLSYQWYLDGEPVAGAVSSSFSLQAAHQGHLVAAEVILTTNLSGVTGTSKLSEAVEVAPR